jgi:hypothetical protein
MAAGAHRSVLASLGLAEGPLGGATALVYRLVEGAAQAVGLGVDTALGTLAPLLEAGDAAPGTPEREAVLAALNGVLGDRLAAEGNPLATAMTLRRDGEATGRALLLVHGLCMNERQWRREREGAVVDHGADLAAAFGFTPVAVRYNSGLPVARNGRELAERLEGLVAAWPVALNELSVLAHSMGGLVVRAAVHHAQLEGMVWPARLKRLVFLGTPHHGAPLERAGSGLDAILGSTPWSAPFARLGALRSAGITDLRYGKVREGEAADDPLPLPAGVACFAIAGTLSSRRRALADALVGDGLVPLDSALGRHADPARCLDIPNTRQWIATRTGHLGLLGSPEVGRKLAAWLGPAD